MIEITIKQHLSVLIGSIEKIYNKAVLTGKLEVKDIYYLNGIYKLLNKVELTNSQNNMLINYYNKLAYYSDTICPPKVIKKYQTTPIPKFQQLESTDCNTYPKNKSILYWQEVYTLNDSQITDLVDDTNYLTDKPSDTYENFEIGKNIDYNKVGKIIFLALESDNKDFIITDVLNNDVTHAFSLTYLPQLNATLFISENIYAHGTIFFRFKKLPTELNQQIFNNIFNNIFA
jgi:hypothetical protein